MVMSSVSCFPRSMPSKPSFGAFQAVGERRTSQQLTQQQIQFSSPPQHQKNETLQYKGIISPAVSFGNNVNISSASNIYMKSNPKTRRKTLGSISNVTKFVGIQPTKSYYAADKNKMTSFELIKKIQTNGNLNKLMTLDPMNTGESQVVAIELNSNWGSKDFLSIAQIDIFDNFNSRVPILKIASVPSLNVDFKPLYDGLIDKKDIKDLWRIVWPQEYRVSLLFFVDIRHNISSVRIFNSNLDPDSSVKGINVKLDQESSILFEVPKSFVAELQLAPKDTELPRMESMKMLAEMFPTLETHKSTNDIYGKCPTTITKSIFFEILSTRCKENYVCLNGLQIFDVNGQKIKWDKIKNVILHNCGLFKDPKILFKENLATDIPELMFRLETKWEANPIIEIQFNEPQILSKVIIWNYNDGEGNLNTGVKKMAIRLDKKLFWLGAVKSALGFARGAANNVTTVWLMDSSSFLDRNNDDDGNEKCLE